MKIAYFDCFSGVSGDMALGALLDAGAELALVQSAIASMGLGEVSLSQRPTKKNGFRASQLVIEHPPEHAHRHLHHIQAMIDRGDFSPRAKQLATAIFERLAQAEAKVHGCEVRKVHFHEVGAIDSIADIVGFAVAWESMGIEAAYASRIPVGTGQIEIAHGTVGVPAPATAELLQGIPLQPSALPYELTTPTGAAIVAELVTGFGPLPSMQVERIGYGAGSRDMPTQPNLLRLLIGTALPTSQTAAPDDTLLVIETHLDDSTGEEIGFAVEQLWQVGAVDVYTTPIQMKKNRPGVLITTLALARDRTAIEQTLFRHTRTLGVRYYRARRTVLPRWTTEVSTVWGSVRGKVVRRPDGETDFSPEFDDCRHLAMEHRVGLDEVGHEAQRQWESGLVQAPDDRPAEWSTSSHPDSDLVADDLSALPVHVAPVEPAWLDDSTASPQADAVDWEAQAINRALDEAADETSSEVHVPLADLGESGPVPAARDDGFADVPSPERLPRSPISRSYHAPSGVPAPHFRRPTTS